MSNRAKKLLWDFRNNERNLAKKNQTLRRKIETSMRTVDAKFCPGYYVYFHFGSRAHLWWVSNLGLESRPFLSCQVFESLCVVSCSFHVNSRFMSNCHLCLNVFSSDHVVSYCSLSLVIDFCLCQMSCNCVL